MGAASLVGRARGCRPIYFKLQARRAALSPPSDRACQTLRKTSHRPEREGRDFLPLTLIAPEPRHADRMSALNLPAHRATPFFPSNRVSLIALALIAPEPPHTRRSAVPKSLLAAAVRLQARV
jgi:hypothetical protein